MVLFPGDGKVTQVFSFRKTENGDFRDSRVQHDIKIIRVSEEGDIDFVVYGYMNRGTHEGYQESVLIIIIMTKMQSKRKCLFRFQSLMNF